MHNTEPLSQEQIKRFLEGSESIEFAGQSRAEVYFAGNLKANREAIARAFERLGFDVATGCCYGEAPVVHRPAQRRFRFL